MDPLSDILTIAQLPRSQTKKGKRKQTATTGLSHLTEAETVGRAFHVDVKQKNLGRLFLAGRRAVESGQEGGRQRVRWHQHVEAANKFAKRHVIRIALPVQPDSWKQFRSAQLQIRNLKRKRKTNGQKMSFDAISWVPFCWPGSSSSLFLIDL
jgi:hypothetical protein